MARRSPSSSSPARRRRSHVPVILTFFAALAALALVIRLVGRREQAAASEDKLLSNLERTALQLHEGKSVGLAQPPSAASPDSSLPEKISAPQKQPETGALPSKPKAMAAEKVREEFEDAASVLKKYFKAPNEEELTTLLRHPAESVPRHRAWARTNSITPALPLRIGPQFGTIGSLLVTSVRLADGSSRLAALEKLPEGYRLDWESFSAWGESRFAELPLKSAAKPVLMRVSVSPSSASAPVEGALAFTLTHPDERTTLAAYVMPDTLIVSPAARKLRDSGSGMFTLLLSMSGADAKSGWASIYSVLSSGWIADTPAE